MLGTNASCIAMGLPPGLTAGVGSSILGRGDQRYMYAGIWKPSTGQACVDSTPAK